MLMFTVHELKLDSMTAAWLLPIVPGIVAAGTGAAVADTLPRQHALDTLLVSYALLGMGLALSFMIMALYLHRLAVHHLPNAEVMPDPAQYPDTCCADQRFNKDTRMLRCNGCPSGTRLCQQ